jgi:ethanolamine utilization protein EutA
MHDVNIDHQHEDLSDADSDAIAQAIWEQETVELRTIGIDIGSSTSHLLFARVTLKRLSQGLSSRFVVTSREVLWRSPIVLTPFLLDGTIDAHSLEHFVHDSYHSAGLKRSDVDTGAVILTGEAIKKKNARAIDEIFAEEAGKFVCATAGHKLECILAAHGSGATAVSKKRAECGLHVDIGGGTTKLALIENGEITSVAAFAVGGRLLAQDKSGAWTRIDDSIYLAAKDLNIAPTSTEFANLATRQAIAKRLAAIVADQITGTPLDSLGQSLDLTEPLSRMPQPRFLTFSGGVSEYMFGRETTEYGDIAKLLATELIAQLKSRVTIPIIEPAERIRATVIGASQFTVQVSGKTIYISDSSALPIHNLPVVHLGIDIPEAIDEASLIAAFSESASRLDLAPTAALALAFTWSATPEYTRLYAVAKAIKKFAAPSGERTEMLALIIDGDVGNSLGRVLHKELNLHCKIASIDGIKLRELDFVDLGEFLDPPGVVPVVIKSLVFS